MVVMSELMEKYRTVEAAKKGLRNVQSKKCRLKKSRHICEEEKQRQLDEILQTEGMIKEILDMYQPKKVFVTVMTAEDIEKLDYEETLKAIKSIQSKKCNVDYITQPDEYKKALDIETMLINHRELLKPCGKYAVRKVDLQSVCDQLKTQGEKLDRDSVVGMLEALLKGGEGQGDN